MSADPRAPAWLEVLRALMSKFSDPPGPPVGFISAEYRRTRAALESGALLEVTRVYPARIINGAGNELIIINNI